MQGTERIEIRLLTESDIPAAMHLKEAAGWNQTELDWSRLIQLEPAGCFAATLNGELVATTTTTTYADELAWIGMVLVKPEKRRLGIATALLETALDYARKKVASVKLDATPAGQPVYEKLGFEVEGLIQRWSRPGTSRVKSDATAEPPRLDDETLEQLLEIDLDAFNADRSELIKSLCANSLGPPLVTRFEDGSLNGYALARKGTRADYIGPIVLRDSQAVGPMLDQMLEILSGPTYIDFNAANLVGSSVLVDRGFVKERDLIRMRHGKSGTDTSPLVFAIAGPEVG